MQHHLNETYDRPPSALRFMARALRPSPGLPRDASFPEISARWNGIRIQARDLAAFNAATDLDRGRGVSILFPHVIGFRLQMAVLTHRGFPLPIWSALQVRNRLIQRRPLRAGDAYVLVTRTDGFRRTRAGIEVDLVTHMVCGEECPWESRISYLYRGVTPKDGSDQAPSPAPDLQLAQPVERFRVPSSRRRQFRYLTGDYNGIHSNDLYARLHGFARAFLHPQRSAGLCLARLQPSISAAQVLDLWIKGPVFYGAAATLVADTGPDRVGFGLHVAGDRRPAIVGDWRALDAGADTSLRPGVCVRGEPK